MQQCQVSTTNSGVQAARASCHPLLRNNGGNSRSFGVIETRARWAGQQCSSRSLSYTIHLKEASLQRGGQGRNSSACATKASADGTDVQASSGPRGVVFVLGGNGFVGSAVVKAAALLGYSVVSVSRRGAPAGGPDASEAWQERVQWKKGDLVADPDLLRQLLDDAKARKQPVVGVIHAVGMLLESESNAIASGSGSLPAEGATYDQVTRQTALAAAGALVDAAATSAEDSSTSRPVPFVFVSAAEAGWTESLGGDPFFTPDFLKRYLKAKREVESRLLEYGTQGALRPVILRPSLVYTPDRLPSLPAVAAFSLGNAIGIPGIDRPVQARWTKQGNCSQPVCLSGL